MMKGEDFLNFFSDSEVEAPILGHLMWIADSFEKTPKLGKIKGRKKGMTKD